MLRIFRLIKSGNETGDGLPVWEDCGVIEVEDHPERIGEIFGAGAYLTMPDNHQEHFYTIPEPVEISE